MAIVFGSDVGQRKVSVSTAGAELHREFDVDGALPKVVEMLPYGSVFIGEAAHFSVARKSEGSRSLAQPWTAEELNDFYDDCEAKGIEVRISSQGRTAFYRKVAASRCKIISEAKTNDLNDAAALATFFQEHSWAALKRPGLRSGFSKQHRIGYALVDSSNVLLNECRAIAYEPNVSPFTSWFYDDDGGLAVLRHLAEDEPETFKVLGAKFDGNGQGNVVGGFLKSSVAKNNMVWTIASLLMVERDGEMCRAVRDKDDEGIGFHWWARYVIRNNDFHFRGGVARSNLYHHTFRNWATRVYDDLPKNSGSATTPRELAAKADALRDFRDHQRNVFNAVSDAIAHLPAVIVKPKTM